MKNKRHLKLVGVFGLALVVLILVFVSACASPAPAPAPAPTPAPLAPELPEVEWFLQVFQATRTTLPVPQFDDLAERVAGKTDGKFKIQVAGPGELGITQEAFPLALTSGLVDACYLLTGALEKSIPSVGIFGLPGLAVSLEEWNEVVSAMQEIVAPEMKKQGFQLASHDSFYFDWPQQMLSRKPIEDMTDLDGLKVRVWRKVDEKLMKVLNAEPLYLDFGEVYMAMQRGVVEALITGSTPMLNAHLYEVGKNWYDVRLPGGVVYFAVNTKSFEALPDKYKGILREEADRWTEICRSNIAVEIDKAHSSLKEKGIQMNELTTAEREAWRVAALAIWEEWATETPEKTRAMEIARKTTGY